MSLLNLMLFYKFCNDVLKFMMNPTSKFMKSTSKTKFSHYFLSNIFNDKF